MKIFLDENFLFGSYINNRPSYNDYSHLGIYKSDFINFLKNFSDPSAVFCGKNKLSLNPDELENSLHNSLVNKFSIYHYHLITEHNKCRSLNCNKSCSRKDFFDKKNINGLTTAPVIHYKSTPSDINIFLFSQQHSHRQFPNFSELKLSSRINNSRHIDMNLFIEFTHFLAEFKTTYPNILFSKNLYDEYQLVYSKISDYFNQEVDFNSFIIDIIMSFKYNQQTNKQTLENIVNDFIKHL